MTLPVAPVVMPSDLAGRTNGKLPVDLLTTVGPSGTLHHAAARAFRALTSAAGAAGFPLTYTYGGTYRTYTQQETLFRSRYVVGGTGGGCKMWNGQQWCKRSSALATAAVPGTSNHGWGLAIDFALGTHPTTAVSLSKPAVDWFIANAATYGYSAELQSEPWHWRYVTGDAIPAAVLAFERPTQPPPPPTPGDERMYLIPPPAERVGGRWLVRTASGYMLASSHDIADGLPQRPFTDEYRVQQYDEALAVASNRQVPA